MAHKPPPPDTSPLNVVSALARPRHFLWSYFSPLSRYHIEQLPTWRAHLLLSYLVAFHIVHGVLEARILKWFAIPFSSGPRFVRTLHHDPFILDGPTQHGFIELDKAGLVVIRLVSFL